MKRNVEDAEFSNLIREAYNWTCCRCNKYFPEGQRQGLHASHIYSRRHQATRFHPLNVVAHCYACHQWFGGNPVEGGRWAVDYLGESSIQTIGNLHRTACKLTKAQKDERRAHYKKEIDRVKKLRKEGHNGIIEVIPWES